MRAAWIGEERSVRNHIHDLCRNFSMQGSFRFKSVLFWIRLFLLSLFLLGPLLGLSGTDMCDLPPSYLPLPPTSCSLRNYNFSLRYMSHLHENVKTCFIYLSAWEKASIHSCFPHTHRLSLSLCACVRTCIQPNDAASLTHSIRANSIYLFIHSFIPPLLGEGPDGFLRQTPPFPSIYPYPP